MLLLTHYVMLCHSHVIICHAGSLYKCIGSVLHTRVFELTKERSIFTTTWSRRRPSVLTEYTTLVCMVYQPVIG